MGDGSGPMSMSYRTRCMTCIAALCLLQLVLACASPAKADQNLVVNPSFEEQLRGWEPSTPVTKAAVDAEVKHSGRFSARIEGNGERAGIGQAEVKFTPPYPVSLTCRYSGMLGAWAPEIEAGLDLRITLDDGKTVWFMLPTFKLRGGDVKKWAEKEAEYDAPSGRRITAVRVLCVNYNNSGPAWFDDILVTAQPPHLPTAKIALLETGESGPMADALVRAGIKLDRIQRRMDLGLYKLGIIPEWREAEDFGYFLRRYHFLGGRLLLPALPDKAFARVLSVYLFDKPPGTLSGDVVTSEDGRAAMIRDAAIVTPERIKAIVADLMRASSEPGKVKEQVRQTRHQLRDNVLLADGKPMLWRGMGAYFVAYPQPKPLNELRRDFSRYRDLGMNGVLIYVPFDMMQEEFRRVLDLVHECGLCAVVWVQGPRQAPFEWPLAERWIRKFALCGNHPAFMAWELADDTYNSFYPALARTAQIIRDCAPGLLITTTMMDPRHPEAVSPEDWTRWRKLLDYPMPYLYSLQRGEHFVRPNIEGGLEDVRLLAENTRRVFGPNAYFHQWCQSHMQGFAGPMLGLGGAGYFVPTPEQMRLLTYMTLSAGTKGIAYFHARAFDDEFLGVGRRAEIGIVWHEIAPVEEFLAAGKRATAKVIGDDTVEAVAFHRPDATLLMLVKHGKNYHRYVDDGVAEVVRVEVALPWLGEGRPQAFAVSYPHVRKLSCELRNGRGEVQVGRFDLTELVLIGKDASLADAAERQREATLAKVARWAIEALCDVKAKHEVVCERLADGHTENVEDRLLAAMSAFAKGDLAGAFLQAREGLLPYRAAEAALIERAEAMIVARKLPGKAYTYTNTFASLPKFYELYANGAKLDPKKMGDEAREKVSQELRKLDGLHR